MDEVIVIKNDDPPRHRCLSTLPTLPAEEAHPHFPIGSLARCTCGRWFVVRREAWPIMGTSWFQTYIWPFGRKERRKIRAYQRAERRRTPYEKALDCPRPSFANDGGEWAPPTDADPARRTP